MAYDIQEMYDGTIRLKYIDTENTRHKYYVSKKVDGKWSEFRQVTGVTTYIGIKDKSTPIKFWAVRITCKFFMDIISGKNPREITKFDIAEGRKLHTKTLERAQDVGTKIHDWIENYIKGNHPAMPQEEIILQAVNAFLALEKQQKWKWTESEKMIYHESSICELCQANGIMSGNEYGGRLDLIAKAGKKQILPDIKTSNGIYNEVMLQTAAYAHAWEAMGNGKIDERWELRLEKRTPEEFDEEMNEKGKVNEVYTPFEPLLLPDTQSEDFQGFLFFLNGFEWNKKSQSLLNAAMKKLS